MIPNIGEDCALLYLVIAPLNFFGAGVVAGTLGSLMALRGSYRSDFKFKKMYNLIDQDKFRYEKEIKPSLEKFDESISSFTESLKENPEKLDKLVEILKK